MIPWRRKSFILTLCRRVGVAIFVAFVKQIEHENVVECNDVRAHRHFVSLLLRLHRHILILREAPGKFYFVLEIFIKKITKHHTALCCESEKCMSSL